MPFFLFVIFSLISAVGAISLIVAKNPVTSAMSMVVSFVGMAALFIGMNAYFVGIIQILVYTGAIMVLFLFIIMLLDLKVAEEKRPKLAAIGAAFIVPGIFVIQLLGVLKETPDGEKNILNPQAEALATVPVATYSLDEETGEEVEVIEYQDVYTAGSPTREKLAEGRIPDVNLIGQKLFTEYNFPLQVMAVLLLVATVGCVVLSKREAPQRAN